MRRTTTAKRRTTRRSARKRKSNPIAVFDILGIALIFLCPISLIALCTGDNGILGQYVAAGMRVSLGIGAYIIPFLFALLGAVFVAGPLKLIPRNIGIGSLIVFVDVVTWASLRANIDLQTPASGGGYLGNAFALLLREATGDVIGYWVLAAVAIIGAYVILDIPVASLIDWLRATWQDWREIVRDRARSPKSARAEAKAVPKAVEEGRKRTLASIFGRGRGEETSEQAEAVAVAKPEVKINAARAAAVAKAPKNGGSKEPEPSEDFGDEAEFQLPASSLLSEPPPPPLRVEGELRKNIEIIERTLEEFKVEANVVEIAVGPTVARYEIRLAPGIKVSKIVGLADNLAMQLAAIHVRVEAPIPGKAAIGVEVPNKNREMVVLRELIESQPFKDDDSKLVFALGKDVAGVPVVADLADMPHMLIGGSTNSGKSVCLNSLIASLLYRSTPEELKMILIDPKRVELSLFDGVPHLACPVVKDVKQAAGVLRSAVQEMDKRYGLLERVGAKKIDTYNERVPVEDRMPYMVIVVDELCDLMMQAAAEVEGSITRLAQLARAVGIHLVIATQRPSVDVITGVIKANIASRVAFAVSSHIDSRTILDQKGAERLIGMGDMLFLPIDAAKPVRIQGCYISEAEIEALCDFLKAQRKPMYTIVPSVVGSSGDGGPGGDDDAFRDEFYEPSVRFVVSTGYCSTSMLQRKFKIGYTRAARMVDAMEQQGIVGALDGAKPRQVLIGKTQVESILGGQTGIHFADSIEDDEDEYLPHAEIIEPDEEEEGKF